MFIHEMLIIIKMTRQLPLLLFLIVLLAFTSCERQPKKKIIAFSQCSQDDWRTAMNNECIQEASFHPDIELRIKSVKDDTEQQIKDIEGFIADKVDLIAIAPNEAVPLTAVVEKAMDAGIPVILADRKIASKRYTAFVGADNYQVGYDAGIYIAERLNGKGTIFEIQGLTGSTPATERNSGFMNVINLYPDIRVISIADGEWFHEVAKEQTKRFIEQHGQVDLIFAHNDQMALGAHDAYAELGLERPHIIGIDALSGPNGGIQMVLDDVIDATFIYPTGGERLIQTAVRILNGNAYSRDNLLYTAVVDKTNARVLKLQTDQIVNQQNSIQRLNGVLNDSLSQYATQRVLFFGSLVVLFFILFLLILLVRAYRKSDKTNKILESQNIAINRQKEELAEQRDQLIVLSKNLEEATHAKLVFFTNVSHEFRTPLTLISGPLETINEKEQLSNSGKQLVQLMRKNVRVLQRLIDQIIDFRKVENGKMQMYFTFNDFRQFISDISDSFHELAIRKHIHLTFKSEEDDFTIWFDSEKVEKIFYNLLSNAFKHTPENGKITIELKRIERNNESFAQVRVIDTGVGISQEHIERIFERFYKASETTAGSGIGLALTKILVEMHNGEINAGSEEGKGSIFTVILPFKQEDIAVNGQIPAPSTAIELKNEIQSVDINIASEQEENPTEQSEKPLVLIVEDNDDVRLYIKTFLSDDYSVIEAVNGKKGLLKAMNHVPELIISDVMMEVMDGFELCRQLKGNLSTSHIPVILLTACSLDEQRAIGFESGADAYIPKPFNEALLKIRVRKLIESRENLKKHFQQSLTFGDKKETVTQIDKTFIEKFRKIVEDNLSDSDLNVDEIGRNMGLSRIQLYRKIKSLTNYAPNELVRTIRLKAAEKLLQSSEKSISEIAYETGFSSPSYFTKCFKEYFNESPTEYLTRIRK